MLAQFTNNGSISWVNNGDYQVIWGGTIRVEAVDVEIGVSVGASPESYQQYTKYLNLFTSQYQRSMKLLSMSNSLMKSLGDIDELAVQFDSHFHVDAAIGDQLDVIGNIVGASRHLPFDPTDGSSSILTDTSYRTLIKATIGINHWNGQAGSLKGLWNNLFPEGSITVVDNHDMTMSAYLSGNFNSTIVDLNS